MGSCARLNRSSRTALTPRRWKLLQFCIGDIGLDHYDATGPIADFVKCVEKAGIVAAVEAWLDDYKPLDAKARHEATILCQCSIGQRVVRPCDVRISFGRSENVHVRVPGTGGQPKSRLERSSRGGRNGNESKGSSLIRISRCLGRALESGCASPACSWIPLSRSLAEPCRQDIRINRREYQRHGAGVEQFHALGGIRTSPRRPPIFRGACAAAMTRLQASSMSAWRRSSTCPRSTDKSFIPTCKTSTPSIAAIASALRDALR